MLEKHDEILICNMTDQHLKAMINMVCAKIYKTRKSIEESQDPVRRYNSIMYNDDSVIDVEDAVRSNTRLTRILYPYLAEAFLRGLDDVRESITRAIGRDSAFNPKFEVFDPQISFGVDKKFGSIVSAHVTFDSREESNNDF